MFFSSNIIINNFTCGYTSLVSYYSIYGPYFNNNTLKVEDKISFSISDYSFVGIIDRIDQEGLNGIKILDYKTGKKNITQKKLSTNLQMGIYSYAIQSKFPQIKVEDIILSHFYVRNGKEISINGSEINYTRFKDKIIKDIKLIEFSEKHNNFEAKESNLCNWCYYWKECDKKTGNNPSLFLE